MRRLFTHITLLTLVILTVMSVVPYDVYAQSSRVQELKSAIEERNDRIQQIEGEIEVYRERIQEVGAEKESLQKAVQQLQLSGQKLQKELDLTVNKLQSVELTLEELNYEISDKRRRIELNNNAIAEAIRNIHKQDQLSLIEVFLADSSLADFWSSVDTLERFQVQMGDSISQLASLKAALEENRVAESERRGELRELRQEIGGQREAVEYAEEEKEELLEETASKESNYRSLLQEKIALRDAFQQELKSYEAELQVVIDPTRIPEARPNVLSWPLDNIIITQHFGNTAFAQSGAYNGNGHNGMDFGAPVGTPVKAAESGVIVATGNTDTTCPNASYGKWVVVEHSNGLSTLYAHLSVIGVSQGQQVVLGQTIGRVGNTGYSTGPHLHFTVYATQGMKIGSLSSGACSGAVYRIPLADLRAYLNPLQFLQ